MHLFSESEIVERANTCYKEDIARLEAEQIHLMNILASHLPACKLGRDPAVYPNGWNSDSSNTFRIPSLPPSQKNNNVVMEVESEDIIVGDYSQAQSDHKRKYQERGSYSEFQNFHFGRPSLRQEQQYSHMTYPTFMRASGYADSVCAVI